MSTQRDGPVEEPLTGGFVNEVVRVGGTVRRAVPERAEFTHALLAHFERAGWRGAPRVLGRDERGREVLEYLPGRAACTPEERRAARTDEALAEVATLVREFHDLTAGTALAGAGEVVCHHDLSPKNTVYAEGWRPVALIDWDIAAPGERIQDLAHVAWQYLELGPDAGEPDEVGRRLRLLCEAYGPTADRARLLETVLWWQDRCWRGIEAGAERGEPAMARLVAAGVPAGIRVASAWVVEHRPALARALG
ncbi:phosphotransferase [Streptomyces triticirhizae]|uniref:Trifolitoxin immunity protein n=1 Tax=Streptomyces triticirhizae TaxID=2483353 RepID=A0A3M2LRT9_9ACTN|nr:phosphotransferase [Streptomyces triticirhizae]RMI39992.1 trifolitoxin immunity protein [Streptomyces triticirhizae]